MIFIKQYAKCLTICFIVAANEKKNINSEKIHEVVICREKYLIDTYNEIHIV